MRPGDYGWRYPAWMAAKLVLVTLITAAVYGVARLTLFRLNYQNNRFDLIQLTFDGILLGFWIVPMIWIGLAAVALHDQKLRCRTCARPLRMPVDEGSYATLLLDHPGTEYVCPYGHGALKVEVWLSSREAPRWRTFGDFWQELFRSSDQTRG